MTWRALSTRGLAASAVQSLWLVAPAVVTLTRLLSGRDWTWPQITAACAGAAAVICAGVLAYDLARLRTTRWRLTAERLELRSGLAERRHRSIPRDRVRSVDIIASPVRRAFGLAVVKVGTGQHGGDGDELTLDPLLRQEAEALRRTLLEPGAEAAEERDAAIARLDWAWIRFAPLTVWSFVGGAVAVGALYKLVGALGFDLLAWQTMAGAWHWLTDRPWVAVPLVVAANVVFGVVGAVAVFAEAWSGYRLEREPGRLRLRRGLLTTRSLTLEERRLRGVEVSEPLLLRLGGAARVKAVATGLRKAGDKETEDVAALTPPMPREPAWEVAARIMGGAATPVLLPHPKAARGRRLRGAVLDTLLLAALVGGLDLLFDRVPWQAWALPVVVLPVALAFAWDGYRGLGHALSRTHLVTRSGSAVRSTVALDRAGIVGWTVRGSWFQRRLGLITLTATTAAGTGHYDVVDVGREAGLELAAHAVPGLIDPFLRRH
ncbi:PH domain-containing protein [Nonomuraea sp. NBC_01738]|uniref:PH domain-containing protein n=1 Tax=Nonomuraea sp. NBC_01738 TaxID=2976003 RepID=UPI002E110C6B|nr:PH domain-containing protein [Nonomuraea sp. NBC_01738]